MILLNTNIVSEMMKQSPDDKVKTWIDHQKTTQLFISTISIAEIFYGIGVLPKGKRKNTLEKAFHNILTEAFEHRILTFDNRASQMYGNIMSHRKMLGKPLSILDGQIAAIARSQRKTLATRNIKDFTNCDLELMNPFE